MGFIDLISEGGDDYVCNDACDWLLYEPLFFSPFPRKKNKRKTKESYFWFVESLGLLSRHTSGLINDCYAGEGKRAGLSFSKRFW